MSEDTVYVYVNPDENISMYPQSLEGDTSVFKSFLEEAQWMAYLMLRESGLDVQICRAYPRDGILLIHKGNAKKFVWNPNLFVVSMQWDYKRDDRAQMHLVANHYQTTKSSLGWLDRLTFAGLQHYVPPVMHSVIIPRNEQRGNRFENLAFLGDPKNLDNALKSEAFHDQIKALDMRFDIVSDAHKHWDFSEIDVVVAVREFGRVVNNKPPVKLINSWRGGVPSILGCEVGFREVRESEYDYIEVDSMEETLEALRRLKEDVDFRNKMVSNAKKRAIPYSTIGRQETWSEFFKDQVLPAGAAWQRRNVVCKLVFLGFRRMRSITRKGASIIWHRLLGREHRDYV